MRPEISVPSKIREELMAQVETLGSYREIERRGNGQLFIMYQILDLIESENGCASHSDINHQVLSANPRGKIQALELLHKAEVLKVENHGSKNLTGGFKIVLCNYSLTEAGRGFARRYLGAIRDLEKKDQTELDVI